MHGRKLDFHKVKAIVLWSFFSATVGTAIALLLVYKPMHDKKLLQERVSITCQQFRETIKIMGTDPVEAAVTKLVNTYKESLCV